MKSVAVFCGAAMGSEPELSKEVVKLVHLLAKHNIELVYGGGKVGLMGLVADTALRCQCKIVGVIPDFLIDRELAYPALSELIVVKSFSERKEAIYKRADAFILLPGGLGSLDEFFDALNQMHVGLLSKQFGILNPMNYYSPILMQLHKATELAFMKPQMYDMIKVSSTAESLLEEILNSEPSKINRWMEVD